MRITKEFTALIGDRPGTLGEICQSLADWRVNIIAFYAFTSGGICLLRMVVDDPVAAKKVLEQARLPYTEAEVVVARVPHRPGELGPSASKLGRANININYAYCGIEPGTNAPLLIFGVADAEMAAATLEQAGAAAATS